MNERITGDRATPEINGIGLDSYLAAVLRYRWLIVGVALAGAITGFVLAISRAPLFEARATVVVNRRTATGDAPPGAQALRMLFVNQGVAAQALSETGLDRPPHSLDTATFLRDYLSLDDLVSGSVLQVRVRFRDPDLAVKACSRLVASAIDLDAQINAEEGLAGQEFIKQQLDNSRQRLDELERRLLAFKTQAQLDVQREDVQALLEGRRELVDLEIRLAAERGRLAAAESEMARRSASREARSGLSDMASRSTENERSVAAQTLAARDQDDLPENAFETLDSEATSSRVRVAELEGRRKELIERLGLAKPTLVQLTELYKRELEEARLQAEYDVSAKVYQDLLTRYEQVRIQVGSRSKGIKLIDPAITATKISKPLASIATALGAAAGTGAGILLAFAFEFFRTGRVGRASAASQS